MNKIEEKFILQREYHDSEAEIQPVLFIYGESVDSLCGSLTIFDGVEFASISTLRQQIIVQREEIQNGSDRDGNECGLDDLDPWMLSEREDEGLIVCKEGVFEWNWESEDYEYVRAYKRTSRRRTIKILRDSVINFGQTEVFLSEGSNFQIDGEYLAYDNEKLTPIPMLVLTKLGYSPFAVPFNKEVMFIQNQDYVVLSTF